MYAMTAAVAPGAVYFDPPALLRSSKSDARELTSLEIESVSGGIACGGLCVAGIVVGFTVGVIAGFSANSGGG